MRNFPRSSPPSFIQGCFHEEPTDLTGITWSALVNQLVNSATDTETTDDMLGEMLPEGRYWRFNPRIGVEPIDDPAPAKLAELKGIARAYADTPATASRLDALARALRPRRTPLAAAARACATPWRAWRGGELAEDPVQRECRSWGDAGIGLLKH